MRIETIKKTAAFDDCPISEGTLRRMVKCGECPGFYSGSRFYVYFDELLNVLERKSKETLCNGAGVR